MDESARVRKLSLYKTNVHGVGSRAESVETTKEALSWVQDAMIPGEYVRFIQYLRNGKWVTLFERRRGKTMVRKPITSQLWNEE